VTNVDLIRFLRAQTQVYSQVVEELTDGRKRSHWIWFVFPQLAGLGYSAMSQLYAIRDIDQATRYLADPILGNRLRRGVQLMPGHKGSPRQKFLGRPTIPSFGPVSPYFVKPPPIKPVELNSR
jgi:uncharacterized protein (DUF1810 family)